MPYYFNSVIYVIYYRGICASDKEVQQRMRPIIPALAAAYSELYKQQKEIDVLRRAKKDEFFGLRDFYR
jgi:hypothetical protein